MTSKPYHTHSANIILKGLQNVKVFDTVLLTILDPLGAVSVNEMPNGFPSCRTLFCTLPISEKQKLPTFRTDLVLENALYHPLIGVLLCFQLSALMKKQRCGG
jgi:hypothetical protein